MGPATFPERLNFDISSLPKLTREQAGHLRHFHNITSALDGQWPHMGGQDQEQALVDAYRYQLACMAYTVASTHYHRMPVMRALFKPLFRRLIHKMLQKDVWGYWYSTSQSGSRLDPGLTQLREPCPDPIHKENIMFNGHLLHMTSLYAMLFNDEEFEQPGSLVFDWNPVFWGLEKDRARFEYDNRSIQGRILAEMEARGWAGACCEPNMVFVVCNQFPIIGMRLNDSRDGTSVAEDVLAKYWPAVQKKNMIRPDGLFADALFDRQQGVLPPSGVGFTAWACAFMNTWNSSFVRSIYSKQITGFVSRISNTTQFEPHHPKVGMEIRRLVQETGASPTDPTTISSARATVLAQLAAKPSSPFMQPLFAYLMMWLSELGKTTELTGLIEYADERFSPTWENGGLFYPRQDEILNESGEWTFVDTLTGNVGIGYGRLHVEDGQRAMYERPWTREDVDARPWVDDIRFSMGVDCLRGHWDGVGCLVVTLKSWDGKTNEVAFTVKNLREGAWAVYEKGVLTSVHKVTAAREEIRVTGLVDVDAEVDFVILCY